MFSTFTLVIIRANYNKLITADPRPTLVTIQQILLYLRGLIMMMMVMITAITIIAIITIIIITVITTSMPLPDILVTMQQVPSIHTYKDS